MDCNLTHILIRGDFNYKEVDWVNEFFAGLYQNIFEFSDTIIQDYFLKQQIAEATRYCEGEESSLLDLSFTNGVVQYLHYHPGLGECKKFNSTSYAIRTSKDVQLPNFYTAYYESVRCRLKCINWISCLNSTFMEVYSKFIH